MRGYRVAPRRSRAVRVMRHIMRKVPITEVSEPKSGLFQVYVDYWWPVSNNDEIYFFGTDQYPFASPQGNHDEYTARHLAETMLVTKDERCRYDDYKETRQLPVIYKPVSISEYVG